MTAVRLNQINHCLGAFQLHVNINVLTIARSSCCPMNFCMSFSFDMSVLVNWLGGMEGGSMNDAGVSLSVWLNLLDGVTAIISDMSPWSNVAIPSEPAGVLLFGPWVSWNRKKDYSEFINKAVAF